MCEGIACGLQGMVVLGLDLPAGSSDLPDGLHRRTIQLVWRRQRMAIPEGAVRFVRDGACTPIDPPRVFTLTPGDVVGLARGVEGAQAPLPPTDGARLESPGGFYANKPRVPRGVRRWFAPQDNVAVGPAYQCTPGWLAGQSVPYNGHVRLPSCLPFHPALRRDLGAVLCLMAIGRRAELGRHGTHLGVPRGDDDGGIPG
jgi:hypothetical protein